MNKLPPKRPNEEPGQHPGGSRRVRLPGEAGCPTMGKVRSLLDEAQNKKGCLIELPWLSSDHKSFILTCQWDDSMKDPIWTLYEEINGTSKVVWTQPFAPQDLEFMFDILSMSAGPASHSAIPAELRPGASLHDEEESVDFQSPDLGGGFAPASPFAGMSPQMGGGMPMAPAPIAPAPMPTPMPQAPVPMQAPPVQQQPVHPYQQQMPYPHAPQAPMGYPYPAQTPPHTPSQPYPGPQGDPYGQQQVPQSYPQPYTQQAPAVYPQPPQQTHYAPPPQPQPYQGQPYTAEPKIHLDYHLIDKGANILLGTLLQEAGLISEPTLEAALKLQELVRDEKMSPDKAPDVLKRLHAMGGSIDQYLTKGDFEKGSAPKEEAKAPPSKPAAPTATGGGRDLKGAFDLLQKAQLLTESDLTTATNVRKKHGGDLVQILEAAGKVNSKTVDAAVTSLPLIREGLMRIDQVIMALNYCERMRVSFDDALDEMGWQNPRKLRTDLPL